MHCRRTSRIGQSLILFCLSLFQVLSRPCFLLRKITCKNCEGSPLPPAQKGFCFRTIKNETHFVCEPRGRTWGWTRFAFSDPLSVCGTVNNFLLRAGACLRFAGATSHAMDEGGWKCYKILMLSTLFIWWESCFLEIRDLSLSLYIVEII